ncbi:acyl-CoA dehydrogenase family protein [Granulosicoccaceae sp. 1_MG-2023]|nr:acyl-CoA dehydrogenase family protein [Granulosicoccaceae sp. 1_MG-2023]
MDFSLNDIQQMLQDSASRFVRNDYGFASRRAIVESAAGYSAAHWQTYAELGWLALPFPEEVGGMGGSLSDLMVLQTELGRGLIVEPYLATVVMAGNLINRHAAAGQKQALLEALISGEQLFSFAGFEAAAQHDIRLISTTAGADGDGYRLNGHKAVVIGAGLGGKLVVVARTGGRPGDAGGLSLFLLDEDAEGVSLQGYTTNDGLRAADVRLSDVLVGPEALLGDAGTAAPAINAMLNDAIVALSAEAVGVMETLLSRTVEFCKVRKQFGVPIGSFQVLQHRMADMFMECEQARSMLYYATIAVAGGCDADVAASRLKVRIGKAARLVGQQAIQLHGGMGVTDELDVGHYFKRLTMINTQLGSRDAHLHRLVQLQSVA